MEQITPNESIALTMVERGFVRAERTSDGWTYRGPIPQKTMEALSSYGFLAFEHGEGGLVALNNIGRKHLPKSKSDAEQTYGWLSLKMAPPGPGKAVKMN